MKRRRASDTLLMLQYLYNFWCYEWTTEREKDRPTGEHNIHGAVAFRLDCFFSLLSFYSSIDALPESSGIIKFILLKCVCLCVRILLVTKMSSIA